MITAKELAHLLDGREYGNEISAREAEWAKESGLVVVYGYSDDNMEFNGALYDEVGCFEGGVAFVTRDNVYGDSECPRGARRIEALWNDSGSPCWTYKTDIPHETFGIYEDGELFCVGIVFRIEDAEEELPNHRDNPKYPAGHVFTLTICPKCHEGYEASYEHICMKKNSYSLEYED